MDRNPEKKEDRLAPGQCMILLDAKGEVAILRYREEMSLDPKGLRLEIPADQLLMVAAQIIMVRHNLKAAVPGAGGFIGPT
jgi:hypothetical protein